jgi:hypothetical protein
LKYILNFILIAFFSTSGYLANCSAVEVGFSSKELAYLSSPLARVRVSSDLANFYVKPDSNSESIWQLPWAVSLEVDGLRLKEAPAEWIPIKALGHVKGKTREISRGWVRRQDVVLPTDYKKVIACWPIESLTFVAGDYSAKVTFKLDGSALVKESTDEVSFNRKSPYKAHVYIARNIVSIDHINRKLGFFTSGYRPEEQRLYPEGAPAKEQRHFPNWRLKNCPSVPLVQEDGNP